MSIKSFLKNRKAAREPKLPETQHDVAIIGGGLAGTMAALHLARNGKKVVLFEKASGAHEKVCGEFLSHECAEYLLEAGIDLSTFRSPIVSKFELHFRKKSISRPLPRVANTLSRKVLDEALLALCLREGVEIQRGTQITQVKSASTSFVEVVSSTGQLTSAKALICATGKAEFKPLGLRAGRDSKWVAYKTHLTLSQSSTAKLRQYIDLFVFKGGYGGMLLTENDQANLAFVVRSDVAKEIGVDWLKISSFLSRENDQLRTFLEFAEPATPRPLTVAPMPYGFVRAKAPAKNVFCVGDQLAVIPSLTGDGMAIAMMSGSSAAKTIIENGYDSAKAFHAQMSALLEPQVNTAYRVHRLFCRPMLLDLAIDAARLWPSAIDMIFNRTRLRLKST